MKTLKIIATYYDVESNTWDSIAQNVDNGLYTMFSDNLASTFDSLKMLGVEVIKDSDSQFFIESEFLDYVESVIGTENFRKLGY